MGWIVTALILLLGLCLLFIVYILGRTKMKEVDKFYYGASFEKDSIFFQLTRFPMYAYFFTSRWAAKRGGHLEIYDHFDSKFKRPFLVAQFIAFIIILFGVLMLF